MFIKRFSFKVGFQALKSVIYFFRIAPFHNSLQVTIFFDNYHMFIDFSPLCIYLQHIDRDDTSIYSVLNVDMLIWETILSGLK